MTIKTFLQNTQSITEENLSITHVTRDKLIEQKKITTRLIITNENELLQDSVLKIIFFCVH